VQWLAFLLHTSEIFYRIIDWRTAIMTGLFHIFPQSLLRQVTITSFHCFPTSGSHFSQWFIYKVYLAKEGTWCKQREGAITVSLQHDWKRPVCMCQPGVHLEITDQIINFIILSWIYWYLPRIYFKILGKTQWVYDEQFHICLLKRTRCRFAN
jgi:hypothetical protein